MTKTLEKYPTSTTAATDKIVAPIRLNLPEGNIEAEIVLPEGHERLVVLTFKVLGISSTVADMAALAAAKHGREISCKKGCGACCSQLVPLSPPEAAMIFEFVATMPESMKNEVTQAFTKAISHLKKTQLLKKLESLQNPSLSKEAYNSIANEYFKERIDCPFLVSDCCIIHEVRPSMCREYLVSSPAVNCKDPEAGGISRLPVSIRLSEALTRVWASVSGNHVQVIPLILALKWTAENEHVRSAAGDSLQLLTSLLGHLSEIVNQRACELVSKSEK